MTTGEARQPAGDARQREVAILDSVNEGVFTVDEQFPELPVVDAEHPEKVIGLLTRRQLIAAYSTRLLAMRQDLPVD